MLDRVIIPFATQATQIPAVRISSAPPMTIVRLKSWLPTHCDGDAPIAIGGYSFPRRVGATALGPIPILCLAPGEWLIVAHESSTELKIQLQTALRQHGVSFTDWSDGFAIYAIEGPMARTLLSKGCGLDLETRSFPSGHCARTRFAGLPVILQCLAELTFQLYVSRSYVNYLHEWITDAALEWQPATSVAQTDFETAPLKTLVAEGNLTCLGF